MAIARLSYCSLINSNHYTMVSFPGAGLLVCVYIYTDHSIQVEALICFCVIPGHHPLYTKCMVGKWLCYSEILDPGIEQLHPIL